jgi:hypothetical protein
MATLQTEHREHNGRLHRRGRSAGFNAFMAEAAKHLAARNDPARRGGRSWSGYCHALLGQPPAVVDPILDMAASLARGCQQ